MTTPEPIAPADIEAITAQLGRAPRGVYRVAHRCPCGNPTVVMTKPRLDDGTPFPTTYYLTCAKLNSQIGTLEASGIMAQMSMRVAEDPELGRAYVQAHEAYLADRASMEAEVGQVSEIAGVSAGGMPTRVKCLHALVGHSLAAGPGVNPIGDEALELLGQWWRPHSCAEGIADAAEADPESGEV